MGVGLAERGLREPELDRGVFLGDERCGTQLAVFIAAVVLVVGTEADAVLLGVELLSVGRLF